MHRSASVHKVEKTNCNKITGCCTSLQLGGLGEVYEEKVETSGSLNSYKL